MSGKSSGEQRQSPDSPREEIGQLRCHLVQTNPYLALWDVYKRGLSAHLVADDWGRFLLEQLGPECAGEIEFARAMAELDKLLTVFADRNLALPGLSFERICFLHFLPSPERMAQTRAILGTLAAELPSCTSA